MFGGWKNSVEVSGDNVEIRIRLDKKKLIVAKGKIELKEKETLGFNVSLESDMLVIKPSIAVSLKQVFKTIEQITKL